MKKVILMLMVAMMVTAAQAKVKFGIKGGVNVTQLSLNVDKYKFNSNNNAGFYVGPTVKISLPLGLGLDASVMYSQSQFKTEVDESEIEGKVENNTVKQKYVSIPVNLRYTFGFGDSANLFVFTGPQFNFNVGDKTLTYIADVMEWKNNSSQFSWNVGLGVTVFKHLQVNVNYNIACSKNTQLNGVGDYSEFKDIASAKTNIWQVGLAWWF